MTQSTMRAAMTINNKMSWDKDFLVELPYNKYADFNILRCEGVFLDYKEFRSNIQKKYFDRSKKHYDEKYKTLTEQVKAFIQRYKQDGRGTVIRYLWCFLTFQYENNHEIGKDKGVAEYRNFLINDVRRKKFSMVTMRSYFSAMNSFLKFIGEIKINYQLPSDENARRVNKKIYTKHDFIEIINILFFINEKSKDIINEHIEAIESGVRNIPLNRLPRRIIRYKTAEYNNSNIEVDIDMPSCYINDYFQSSLLLFSLFTWGNKKQLLDLDVGNIHLTDEGVETDFVFKARAQKFVRYNIGKSSIEGHRTGLRWFKGFLEARERILSFLQRHERGNYTEALFVKTTGRSSANIIPIRDDARTDFFAIYKLTQALKSKGINIPAISLAAIRNTAEQLADQNLNNPLVIAQKAQHEWGTYQKYYAKGVNKHTNLTHLRI